MAVIILKVEPGAYWPATDLLISGVRVLASSERHRGPLMPLLNSLGSKLGTEARTRTSPLCTSMRTAAALSLGASRVTA